MSRSEFFHFLESSIIDREAALSKAKETAYSLRRNADCPNGYPVMLDSPPEDLLFQIKRALNDTTFCTAEILKRIERFEAQEAETQ